MAYKEITEEYLRLLAEKKYEENKKAYHREWLTITGRSLRYTYKDNPELQEEWNCLLTKAMVKVGFLRTFKPAKNELIKCNNFSEEEGCKNGFFCNFAHSNEELESWKNNNSEYVLNALIKFLDWKKEVDIRNLTGVIKQSKVGFFLSNSIREHFFDGNSAFKILKEDKRFLTNIDYILK